MNKSNEIIVICDASVLIDFIKTNQNVLSLCVKHLFQIYLPLPILKEVKQLSVTSAKKIGMVVVEPELNDLVKARQRVGRLSFEDLVCLEMAKRNSWVCATNDKFLRKECIEANVNLLWGFDLLLKLNVKGFLSKSEATITVKEIQKLNLRIKHGTINAFVKKLK